MTPELRDRVAKALRDTPELPAEAVGRRFDLAAETVRRLRRELGLSLRRESLFFIDRHRETFKQRAARARDE